MLTAPRITIRFASPEDRLSVIRLAALDSQAAPSGQLLLCEVGGELAAALALDARRACGQPHRVLADPFRPTAHLVELLRVQAAAVQDCTTVTGRE